METEKQYYLTKEGLRKIQKEYEQIKKIKLAKIQGESPKILESEDFNPEYLIFEDDLSFLEARTMELEKILKNSKLLKKPMPKERNIVHLGATVTLEDESGHINEFTVVDSLEANPGKGWISGDSPVGKALLGKKLEEEVTILSPIKIKYKIKKIRYRLD